MKRDSDFSLSNFGNRNANGEITPVSQLVVENVDMGDANLSNDDIDKIECGKSCEGVEDRNNIFD